MRLSFVHIINGLIVVIPVCGDIELIRRFDIPEIYKGVNFREFDDPRVPEIPPLPMRGSYILCGLHPY